MVVPDMEGPIVFCDHASMRRVVFRHSLVVVVVVLVVVVDGGVQNGRC
jgi:hypothetical protein